MSEKQPGDGQVPGPATEGKPAGVPLVAALAGARMPADRGLSSLGLLMQLGSTISLILMVFMAIGVSVVGAGAATVALFAVCVMSGIRSHYHRRAGLALLYGKDTSPLRAVRTYIGLAFVHALFSLFLLKGYVDTRLMVDLGVLFLGWPVALLVYVSLPHIKSLLRSGTPASEDLGFEGSAVLMTLFGLMGTIVAGVGLTVWLDGNLGRVFAVPETGVLALVACALLMRSIVHTLAGFKGISGASFDECNAGAGRYCNLGIGSAICIGMTLFVVSFMISGHLGVQAGHLGVALSIGGLAACLLLSWPNILRRLYVERNLDVVLAGAKAPTFQRAPDAGLIALGWALIAIAVCSLGQALGQALVAASPGADMVTGAALRSPWWSVGISGLQLWAGTELVRMSERHKLAAMLYGVVTSAVVFYVFWPAAHALGRGLAGTLHNGSLFLGHLFTGMVGLNLLLAIATLVLVNRVTVPAAVVYRRIRKA